MVVIKDTTVRMSTYVCFDDFCKLGYQFCESVKQVCRHCEDFRDHCGKDHLHISNCSSYCRENMPNNDIECNQYIPWMVCGIIAFLAVASHVVLYIYRRRQNTCKKKTDSLYNVNKEEDTVLLKQEKEKTHDEIVHLDEFKRDTDSEGSSSVGANLLNQIPAANDRGDKPQIAPSGKQLHPREDSEIFNVNQ